MSFVTHTHQGAIDDAGETTIVPAPDEGRHVVPVGGLWICNNSGGAIVVELRYYQGNSYISRVQSIDNAATFVSSSSDNFDSDEYLAAICTTEPGGASPTYRCVYANHT